MSDKPTNGAGPSTEGEDQINDAAPAAEPAARAGDDEEFPVEVEPGDAGAAGEAAGAGLASDDWAAIVGNLSQDKGALEAKVAALEDEKRELYERMLRAVADADNARKRARKDVDEARVESRGRTLREILPVIDNLERALQHAEQGGAGDGAAGVIDGVKLVLRQFEQALERCDARPVDAKGKPFDPNLHEAISQQESAEVEPGTVIDVLQRGYKIGERLLRPSLVVVASAPKASPRRTGDDGAAADDSDQPSGGEE
jgi:molecular chaperone GrpE